MKLKEDQVRKLLLAMGVPHVEKWGLDRLQKNVNKLDQQIEGLKEPEGDDLLLFRSISDSLQEGVKIMVEAVEEKEVAEVKTKPKKKASKPNSNGNGKVKEEKEESKEAKNKTKPGKKPKEEVKEVVEVKEDAAPKKKGRPKKEAETSDDRPGICKYILKVLSKATEKRPVSKPDMVQKLLGEFPDRPEIALTKTLNSQLGWHLPKRGVTVARNDKGYWVVGKEAE